MRRWLSRNLVVLSLVSLLQDAASEFLYPLLPLLLTGVLAAPPVVLGVIEGLADATAGITKYVAGRWSDARGRKPFIAIGYSLAALGKAFVAAATVWPMVLFGRVTDRFGKGIRSAPRDAMIASSVTADALGRAFGFHRMADTAGAVIGPLLGLLALSLLDNDLRRVLWWAVIPGIASALLVMLVRTPEQEYVERAQRRVTPKHPLPPQFWRVLVPLSVIALLNFADALLLLRFVDLGYSTTQVVLAYVAFNSVYTLLAFPAGLVADRLHPLFVYVLGLLGFGVAYLGLGIADGGWAPFVLMAVYGVFPALTDGVGKAWIARIVPAEHRGRGQGVFQAWNAIGILLAGTWAGLLWEAGPGNGVLPLTVSGVLGLVAAAMLLVFRKHLIRVP